MHCFLTTFLFTTLLSLLKSTGTVCNLSASNLATFHLKLAKSFFLTNCDVSMPVAPFQSHFVAKLEKFY